MIVGAVGWAIAGLVLIAKPENGISYIGFNSDENTLWALRSLGLIVIAFAVHMSTTSRHAADRPFRRTALFMILFELAIAALVYSAPGESTTGRWVVVVTGGLFALLYVITLPMKSIGYKEGEPQSA
jgi:hypothetical protein